MFLLFNRAELHGLKLICWHKQSSDILWVTLLHLFNLLFLPNSNIRKLTFVTSLFGLLELVKTFSVP